MGAKVSICSSSTLAGTHLYISLALSDHQQHVILSPQLNLIGVSQGRSYGWRDTAQLTPAPPKSRDHLPVIDDFHLLTITFHFRDTGEPLTQAHIFTCLHFLSIFLGDAKWGMWWRMNYKAKELPEMLADLKSGTGLVVVRSATSKCAVLTSGFTFLSFWKWRMLPWPMTRNEWYYKCEGVFFIL